MNDAYIGKVINNQNGLNLIMSNETLISIIASSAVKFTKICNSLEACRLFINSQVARNCIVTNYTVTESIMSTSSNMIAAMKESTNYQQYTTTTKNTSTLYVKLPDTEGAVVFLIDIISPRTQTSPTIYGPLYNQMNVYPSVPTGTVSPVRIGKFLYKSAKISIEFGTGVAGRGSDSGATYFIM